jgi:SAM-dependent methyltransferase
MIEMIPNEFNPNIFSPFYFIRSEILEAVQGFASHTSSNGKLLDFGCGAKPYRSLFQVKDYIGLDYENPGHPHLDEQIDIIYDGGALPFDDKCFDYALCTEVFEHIFDLEYKIQELHRVLRDKGKIFVTCPFVWNEHEVPHDYARYTFYSLEHLLGKNGFEIIEFDRRGHFFKAMIQIFFLYFSNNQEKETIKISIPFWKKPIIAAFNLLGILLSKLLKTNNSFYLSNCFVAVKK